MNYLGIDENEDSLFLNIKNILLVSIRCSYMALKKEDVQAWALTLSTVTDLVCVPISIYLTLVLLINYLFSLILKGVK